MLHFDELLDIAAGSRSSMKAILGAFKTWMDQSGRSRTKITCVLAMSV